MLLVLNECSEPSSMLMVHLTARLDMIRLLLALAAQIGQKIHQLDVKFKKALYGLKQAPKAWYERIDDYLQNLGFEKNLNEPTFYMKVEKATALIKLKLQMVKMFEMSYLGKMRYFLGMKVQQFGEGIFISQQSFSLKILEMFYMKRCKLAITLIALGEELSRNGDFEKVD
ncbi:pleiotropic drug resistance protein 3-like [Gossypium australe]|uniref:Pleiotropic drug resistance protein 3-like n=1 Tax=Gossypium australe TaxID=47621 RepID=A0A5B6VZ21_9ROSI|nr:pleiotropic drug resistance protein 3-like [Gossypium australe]